MTPIAVWFRKDVRRFALWLVVWAGLLSLRVAIALGGGPRDVFGIGGWAPWTARLGLDVFAVAATTVLFVLIAVLVVHEDPPSDVRAFWTTRAISGRQLFAAKAFFVLALLVVPAALVDLAGIAAAGMDSRLVVRALPEIVLEWSAWAMAAIALAAVTLTLPGFLGVAFAVGLVILGTWLAIGGFLFGRHGLAGLMWFAHLLGAPSRNLLVAEALREASRAIGISTIVVFLGAIVAERAWGLRRVRLARTVVLCSVAALTVGWLAWPYGSAWNAVTAPKAYAGVGLAMDPIGSARRSTGHGGAEPSMVVRGSFTFTDVPPGLVPEVVRVHGTLGYVDGRTFDATGDVGRNPMAPTWNVPAIERLLDGAGVVNAGLFEPDGLAPIVSLPADEFVRRQPQHGRLELSADVDLRRYETSGTVPLRAGATFRHDGEEFVIESATVEKGYCTVLARGAHVSLWVEPKPTRVQRMFVFRFDPDVIWVLRNPVRREAILPAREMSVGFGWPTDMRLDRVYWALNYQTPAYVDDAWLRDAELVRIAVTTGGEVSRSFVLPAFAIDEAAGEPARTDARTYPAVGASGPPPVSDAKPREPADEPGLALCTLSAASLMTLDWGCDTMRTAGLSVVARRKVPGAGVEFDVRVDARPRTPPSPRQGWRDDNTLYLVSSERGGQRALVDLDLAQCETFALRFMLVSIDGEEPGYDTPQIQVGAVDPEEGVPSPYRLAVPTWSTNAYAATGNAGKEPPWVRQFGFVMQLDDPRWTDRHAMLRLRVEPFADVPALDPPTLPRRATLSLDTLRSLVALRGGVFVREPSTPEGAVDLDLRLDGNVVLSAPAGLFAQVRGAYDFVEVRATLLAVNGRTDVPKRIAVFFVGGLVNETPGLSLETDPSAIVWLTTAKLRDMVALEVSPLWTEETRAIDVESVTLRLEPVPGATPVP